MEQLEKITIYSKGKVYPNPGEGCFATLVFSKFEQDTIRKKYRKTTNNRMEIMGILFALENIKDRHFVVICSDSQYLVKTIKGKDYLSWIETDDPKRSNLDLWKQFNEFDKKHKIVAYWDSNQSENKYYKACKDLLKEAKEDKNILIDYGYEK